MMLYGWIGLDNKDPNVLEMIASLVIRKVPPGQKPA